MKNKKLTLPLVRLIRFSIFLIILSIGCKKKDSTIRSSDRNYLEYSGKESSTKELIKQISLIDSANSVLASSVKTDSIFWEKTILIGKITDSKIVNQSLFAIVPYADNSKNLNGYIKLGIELNGKINRLETSSVRDFTKINKEQKIESRGIYENLRKSGLNIRKDLISPLLLNNNAVTIEKTLNSKGKVNTPKLESGNLTAQRCTASFEVSIIVNGWSCSVDQFNQLLYYIGQHIRIQLTAYGLTPQISGNTFRINFPGLYDIGIETIEEQLRQAISTWPISPNNQYGYCTSIPIDYRIDNYKPTCDSDPALCVGVAEELQALASDIATNSSVVSEFTEAESENASKKNLYWTFHKQNQGLWYFESHEIARFDPANKISSLTHEDQYFRGVSPGGGISITILEANPNIFPNLSTASIQLKYFLTASPLKCPLIPSITTRNYEASHIFSKLELYGR